MTYTIFVSHTHLDKKIAENVKKVINNAFSGHIVLYLAAHELLPGRTWKEEVKQRLDTCDAIISIITSRSLSKPWIYIEWTAFWMTDKPSYVFLNDEVQVNDLVTPMSALQVVKMSSSEDVNMLFKSLARDSKFQGATPFEYVENFTSGFIASEELVRQTVAQQAYGKYKNDLSQLPSENDKKGEIAEYFIQQGDFNTFELVLAEIRNDTVKVTLAKNLIEQGDLIHTAPVVRSITASNYLKSVAKTLFDSGYGNSPLMKEIIGEITNHTELRVLGRHIAQSKGENITIFTYVVNHFESYVELYKLGLELLDRGFTDLIGFDALVKRLSEGNQLYLRKFAEAFLDRNMEDDPKLDRVIQGLNQSQMQKLAEYWCQNNAQSALKYTKSNNPTNSKFSEILTHQLS